MIDNKGRLSDVNQKNVDQLITNIEESAKLMVQLSRMPWLKLYLHMDENQRQLAMATENLADFIDMFQVSLVALTIELLDSYCTQLQISVSTAAWQEQSRLDHERDLQLLLQKQEEARQDDQALLRLLELKGELPCTMI